MEVDQQDYYVPRCDEELKPRKGKIFRTIEDGIEFYKNYARIVGFDTRLSSAKNVGGTLIWRYVVCSREGEKHAAGDVNDCSEEAKNKRRRVSMRCGCMARVVFKFSSDFGYIVHFFNEQHNHPLVEDRYKQFMKSNRKLDYAHQKFILDCAGAIIGPTLSNKLLIEILGGHDSVDCSVVEGRNITRDMKAFIEGSDAQIFLNQMSRKKELCEAFTFEYEVDSEDKLKRLFWCDPVSRRNYHMFGDVLAFDTTDSTNKYNMIFASFMGKDNHGKPVTFGAGLLSNKDSASFSWLFQKFIACMGAPPNLIITDQDSGMKVAIEQVLIGTRHRWCMWHIILNMADKVPKNLHENEDFKKELNSYVWSEQIEPEVFEEGWRSIMIKYGLVGDSWFKTMFEDRHYWVPAFFRDFPMSGLVRTTCISESENNRYTRSRSNLLEFLMNYDHAIAAQRNSNAHMNYLDTSILPNLDTKLALEKHAASVYSSKIFGAVKDEILAACYECRFLEIHKGNIEEYKIMDDDLEKVFDVVYSKDDETFVCECKMFVRMGLLCRHMFFVIKNKVITSIPDKYIVGRWKKLSLLKPVHDVEFGGAEKYVDVDETKIMSNKIISSVINWASKMDGDNEKMSSFLRGINELGECITGGEATPTSRRKREKLLDEAESEAEGSGSRLV